MTTRINYILENELKRQVSTVERSAITETERHHISGLREGNDNGIYKTRHMVQVYDVYRLIYEHIDDYMKDYDYLPLKRGWNVNMIHISVSRCGTWKYICLQYEADTGNGDYIVYVHCIFYRKPRLGEVIHRDIHHFIENTPDIHEIARYVQEFAEYDIYEL